MTGFAALTWVVAAVFIVGFGYMLLICAKRRRKKEVEIAKNLTINGSQNADVVAFEEYLSEFRDSLRRYKNGELPVEPVYKARAWFLCRKPEVGVMRVTEMEQDWIRAHGGNENCDVTSIEIMRIMKQDDSVDLDSRTPQIAV